MTDTFKEIGSLFGREGAGAGFSIEQVKRFPELLASPAVLANSPTREDGKQNFIRYFALLRDMDAFVFVSGRKIEALEDLSGLPLAGNCSGLDIDRILQRPKCLG